MPAACPSNESQGRQAGFALVEVLAALAILALSLGVLFAVLSDGARRAGHAERLAEAGLHAQSLLARVGSEIALNPVTTGEFPNGLRWQLRIEPYGDAADRRAWPAGAYKVAAEVAWNDGAQERSLTLTTLRLGPKESR